MHYPSFAEYSDALQLSLDVVLSDPMLGRGTLRMHGPGLPFAHTGSFALTFEVSVDGKTYAVRCFHTHIDSLHVRYDAIADCLRSIGSPYFVDFDFQPSGITTRSGTYPVVRMEWAEGQTLAAFVCDHRNDAGTLQELRSSLRELARHLREQGIAHGDIHPTNIIVQSATNLRLIDYGGMFVPQLTTLQSTELGQPNFQHPGRRARHFDAHLDAFSFSLIDLALDALCRRPDLWERTGSGEDAFILRAADLVDPARSPAFSLLAGVPGLERRVKHLAAVCASSFDRIPSFEDFLAARNIPEAPVVFSGDATMPLRRGDDWTYDVVDATDFAHCYTRVGDRVELIGRIVRTSASHGPQRASRSMRVEFSERSDDSVYLEIGPDALATLDQVPDETWVGHWVRAIGLIAPSLESTREAQRQTDISIAITDASQLRRITEAEARYRLRGYRGRTRPALATTARVATKPAASDSAPLRPATNASVPPSQVISAPQPSAIDASTPPSRVVSAPSGLSHWPWRVVAAAIAALAIGALLLAKASRERAPQSHSAAEASSSTLASTRVVPPAGSGPASHLEAQQDLRVASLPVETVGGTLDIGTASDAGAARVVLLNGDDVPGLRDDEITLVHRAVFSDHEVVVGFTQCDGASAPCGLRQPFWIELRALLPPNVRRVPGLWASTGAGSVAAAGGEVNVDLGVWNGERRNAVLTAAGNIVVSRTREPSRRLNAADCATVARAADACTTSRDCSSFASSARPLSASQLAQVTRLYHESTGLDAAAFRSLCVRSCQLGLTPSRGFIRTHVCGGAQPDQWPPGDPAAGLILDRSDVLAARDSS